MSDKSIVLIAHNIRSTHNVGSLLRTSDAMSVNHVYMSGYTPYPAAPNDSRLPHLRQKIDRQIQKTSLGAERSVKWAHREDIFELLKNLKARGFLIVALEQTNQAQKLDAFRPKQNIVLIVGSELKGLEDKILDAADEHVQIPMLGAKESLNVAVAGAIALYHLRSIAK